MYPDDVITDSCSVCFDCCKRLSMRTLKVGFDEDAFDNQEAREINDEVNQAEHN